jgi:glycosyltransferase involved in cell wall biosynthesis
MTILQVVLSLRVGGLERVVIDLVQNASPEFRLSVCCLEEAGAWARKVPRVIEMHKRPGMDWRLFGRIARVARQENAQVIHTHNATAHFYGAIAGKLAGVKVLHTEHGVNVGHEARYARLNRLAAPFTDSTVSVSKWRDEVPVLPNGINVERFAAAGGGRAGCLSPPSPARVGSIGRLVREKNYPLLIRAVAGIPGAELVLVGDGPMRVQLTGAQLLGARSDIPELLASFDVFVLSSSTEGMSIALLEAMAAGCPIVVTAVGGNIELIQHEVTGLVVPPDNELALRSAIQRLLTDRTLAARLGAAAQAKAREQFSVATMTRRYEELWRRLAA